MPTRTIIGKCLLLEILNSKYMTQADLVEKTGIAKSQISEYISNKSTMSLNTAKVIALALNCSIDDLYEWNTQE